MGRALLLLGTMLWVAPVQAQDPTPSAEDSTAPAFYTNRQARRGQNTYKKYCNSCHSTAAYTGVVFRRNWAGRSVFELWEQIRTTMPNDAPGRLKPEEYADIVAYMLKLNGFPDGPDELPADAEALRALRLTPPPESRP